MIHTTSLPISFPSYRVERKGGRREVGKDALLQGLCGSIWKKTQILSLVVCWLNTSKDSIFAVVSVLSLHHIFCNHIYNDQPMGDTQWTQMCFLQLS